MKPEPWGKASVLQYYSGGIQDTKVLKHLGTVSPMGSLSRKMSKCAFHPQNQGRRTSRLYARAFSTNCFCSNPLTSSYSPLPQILLDNLLLSP